MTLGGHQLDYKIFKKNPLRKSKFKSLICYTFTLRKLFFLFYIFFGLRYVVYLATGDSFKTNFFTIFLNLKIWSSFIFMNKSSGPRITTNNPPFFMRCIFFNFICAHRGASLRWETLWSSILIIDSMIYKKNWENETLKNELEKYLT